MATQVKAQAAGQRAMSEAGDSDKYKWLARLGYASRGVVYLIVGGFAVTAAFGGGKTTGTKGALESLLGEPFGIALLVVLTLGLVAYAGWRAVQAIADADGHGTDAKGLAVRGGLAVSAVTHIILAIYAASLTFDGSGSGSGSGGGSGGGGTQGWVSTLMEQPFGVWLVGIAGAAIAGAGIAHIIKGVKAKFEKRFSSNYNKAGWVRPLCRFGLVARGVVFMMVGGFIINAAWQYDPSEAKGLSGALDSLQQQPYGQVLLGIVALGLVAFGTYSIVEAVYRRIGMEQDG